jgi:hypothetical protein
MAPRYGLPRGFKLAQLRALAAAAAAALSRSVPFRFPSLSSSFAALNLVLLFFTAPTCKNSFPVMAQAGENSQQFLRVRATFPVCKQQGTSTL